MAASISSSPPPPEQDLLGQTVLLIGGSSGIGLEAARLARAQGADIILTARNPDRLYRAGLELGASIAAFDATDFGRLGRFFDALPAPIDHLLITVLVPTTRSWLSSTSTRRAAISTPISSCLCRSPRTSRARSAREAPCSSWGVPAAVAPQRASRSLRRSQPRLSAVTRDLALEVAPVRVNLIVAGYAGTLPGGTRPAGRVAGPASIAAVAVHLMTNTAVTGATFDIDSGQRAVGR